DPTTIGPRTSLYFSMIALSLAAMISAGMLRLRLLPRYGAWNAFLIAAAGYLIVVSAAGLTLPTINEVPEQSPAALLWEFRIVSLGAQRIVGGTIGLVLGALVERAGMIRVAGSKNKI